MENVLYKILSTLRFFKNTYDESLSIRQIENGTCTIIVVYVSAMLIVKHDEAELQMAARMDSKVKLRVENVVTKSSRNVHVLRSISRST